MIWAWLGFFAFMAVLVAVHCRWSTPNLRSATRRSTASLAVGLSFVGFVYLMYERAWFGATLVEPSNRPGIDAATMFLSAYLLEGVLGVDTLFVFALVFRAYGVPTKSQP
jgi:hypothetical protein